MSFDESDDDEYEMEPLSSAPRTVCPNCNGVGEVPKLVLAVIAGGAHTVNAGAVCPLCEGSSALPGMVAPV